MYITPFTLLIYTQILENNLKAWTDRKMAEYLGKYCPLPYSYSI